MEHTSTDDSTLQPDLQSLKIMECLADAVLAADATGTIVYINAATEALLGYPRTKLLGQPLTVVMPQRMQSSHEAGMKRYLNTGVPRILGKPVRVPALHADGSEINIELTVSYFCPQASAPLFVASLRDLRGRIELERQVVAQRRLRAQHALMTVLATSESFAAAAPRLLQALCQTLQWDVGLFWTLDPKVRRMKLFASWCGPDAALHRFCAQNQPHSFAQGEGVVGSVWATRKPIWRQHIDTDGQYLRRPLAEQNGLKESILFPVVNNAEVLGVIEFVNRQLSEPDTELIETLATASFQIGQFQERLTAKAELYETKQWLVTTLRSIADAIIVTDTAARVVLMNAAAERLTGCSETAAKQCTIGQVLKTSLVNQEAISQYTTGLMQQSGTRLLPLEIALEDAKGRTQALELSGAAVVEAQRQLGAALILRDVTAAKWKQATARLLARASTELAASLDHTTVLKRLAQLAVPDFADCCLIYIKPRDSNKVSLAAAAHRDPMLAPLLHQIEERNVFDVDSPSGAAQVMRTGKPELLAHIDDALLWARATAEEHREVICLLKPRSAITVPLGARGRIFGAITAFTSDCRPVYGAEDLQLALALAEQVSQAVDNAWLYTEAKQAIAVRDDFLSIASHELKTPLTPLQLQVQSMQRNAANLPPKLVKKLSVMRHQITRLDRLITFLLDIARLSANRLELNCEAMNLAEMLRSIVERFAPEGAKTNTALSLTAPQEVIGHWDSMRLEQVVCNLLSNAMKFGAGSPINLTLRCQAGTAILEVTDLGLGIAPADQARIFLRYERAVSSRRYGGFGLGLWISRQFIEAMGGKISVSSQFGAGSTFHVELPLAPSTPCKTAVPA